MSFKITLNTSTIKPQKLMDKIRLTAKAGYDGVELWINDIYEYIGQGGEVSDIEKELDATGLFVPCTIALRLWGEAEGFEYNIQLDEVKRRMELAARIGSPYIVATPPFMPASHEQITERYRDLLEIGRAAGVKPTFEYISFFKSVFRTRQAWQVVQNADDPDATIILDAFHNWNSASTLEDMAAIPGDRIAHYHIDDAAKGRPQMQQIDADRVMVGDGVCDLKGEIDLLKEKNYQGCVSLELFNPELWQQDPLDVLKLGLERVKEVVG
jgi:2-keto-myo-inositol isomerase